MMKLTITPTTIVNETPRPFPGFLLACSLSHSEERPLALLSFSAEVRLEKGLTLVQPKRAADSMSYPAVIEPGKPAEICLAVGFSPEALAAIEDQRSRDGDLTFVVNANALVAPVLRTQGNEGNLMMGPPETAFVECRHPDGFLKGFRISRDRWSTLLKTFGYSDLELFELPVPVFRDQAIRSEVVGALRRAEAAFRQGNWEETLGASRAAFEGLATAAAESPSTAGGFKQLWSEAFPDEIEKPKGEALDEIVRGLGRFQHLGRHLTHPFTPVDRRDALFSLRMTLSLFEYLGQRLAKRG
jgi:hypothetical protein